VSEISIRISTFTDSDLITNYIFAGLFAIMFDAEELLLFNPVLIIRTNAVVSKEKMVLAVGNALKVTSTTHFIQDLRDCGIGGSVKMPKITFRVWDDGKV
jgi:hypothetical protein